MRSKIKLWKQILFWRLLRKSSIFNYWYAKFLQELLYDLEISDIEKDSIYNKYLNKFKAINE